MLDILKNLAGTSVPTLLMGLGGVLLLLAFVQKIGTQLELARDRQRLAAVTGVALMAIGVSLQIVPALSPVLVARANQEQTKAGAVAEASVHVPESRLAELLPSSDEMADTLGRPGAPADDFTLSPEEVLKDWGTFLPEFRAAMAEGAYSGAGIDLAGPCDPTDDGGGVQGYVATVEQFRDVASAEAYWQLVQQALTVQSDELVKFGDGSLVDAWVEDCGETEQTVYQRHTRHRNFVLLAGLRAPERPVSDPGLEAISEAILSLIAGKIDAAG